MKTIEPGAVVAMRESELVVANLKMLLSRRGHGVPKWSNLRSDPDVIEAYGRSACTP